MLVVEDFTPCADIVAMGLVKGRLCYFLRRAPSSAFSEVACHFEVLKQAQVSGSQITLSCTLGSSLHSFSEIT